jgi:hypothetical protein
MEIIPGYLELEVTRIKDIRLALRLWEDALALARGIGCTPGQIWNARNVSVSLLGWIPVKDVGLTFNAHQPVLDHLVEILDVEGLDLEKVPGLSRYRIL